MQPTRPSIADVLIHGHDPESFVLLAGDRSITRAALSDAVDERAETLDLPDRSLVVLTGSNSIELVITYLALHRRHHVPLLAGSNPRRIIDTWGPDAVVRAETGAATIERVDRPRRELHHDLALLLSTSGSTGSPKLVRLSHENLISNARAITEFQDLRPGDVGVTNLPLHYCFGLSVLHSHLVAGAAIVVTDASVVDPCFERLLVDHRVTNLAGVPHTFDLIERSGPERIQVPSLRFMAQAGGRMAPATTGRWAERAQSWGVDWFAMYGQTEATARMAYLPPALALERPETIGVAIPGGRLTVEPVDGQERPLAAGDVGELVYRGANTMLGYAEQPADLALGRTVTELRTGDLGRFHQDDGVFEIVGRRSRLVKPFGVRLDLDDVEQRLARRVGDGDVAVAGDDDGLAIAVARPASTEAAEVVRTEAMALTTLPATRVNVVVVDEMPRTESGKVDHAHILTMVPSVAAPAETPTVTPRPSQRFARGDADDEAVRRAVRTVYADVLARRDVGPADTFVSLGGDSLGYVECSIRLEAALGELPADWHLTPVASFVLPSTRRRRLARVDATVVLRAVGICLVVATHMHVAFVPGGAHLLLAVAGYNLARFMMPIGSVRERSRAGVRTAVRVAVPTMIWAAIGLLFLGRYGPGTVLLVNNYVGPRSHGGDHWHFWFMEVFVHLVLLTTALLAIPAVRRLERRFPYRFALVLLAATLPLRMDWADLGDWYNMRYRTHAVAFFFVLGWLIQRSDTTRKRILTALACIVSVPGFFQNSSREWMIIGLLVAVLWIREVPLPRFIVRLVALVAAASLWILITHFTIWPPLVGWIGTDAAYIPTVALGVFAWWMIRRAGPTARRVIAPSARSCLRHLAQPSLAFRPRRTRPANPPIADLRGGR